MSFAGTSHHLRVFFAIDLPETIRQDIEKLIHTLQKKFKQDAVRWVKTDHLHITLQFIAAIQSTDIEPLIALAREKTILFQSFDVAITELELFPSPHRPHVISLKIEPQLQLKKLSEALGECIIEMGYPIETRPYRGHLTLGRIQPAQKISLPKKIILQKSFAASRIVLYHSEPQLHGSHYTALAQIEIKK